MPPTEPASSTARTPHGQQPGAPQTVRGRLEFRGVPLDRAALSSLFPEFAAGEAAIGVAGWRGSRGRDRRRARAAAPGVALLTLDHGLLRAPPRRRAAVPLLSVTAPFAAGPHSAADMLSPDRVLWVQGWETPGLIERARAARSELARGRIGGSWWGRAALPRDEGLAVIDCQAGRDPPSPPALQAMLAAVLADNPTGKIVLLACDRAVSREFLGEAAARGCTVVTRPVDPWAAAERARRVYTMGGDTGFIALLAGVEVNCFGEAFYSGWGVTRDAPGLPQKPFRRGLDEIFAGACLVATRCRDPFRNRLAPFEDIATMLAEWRKIDEVNRSVAVCVGMSFWKRRRVADFFRSSAGRPVFRRSAARALAAASARPGSAIAVWASRAPDGLIAEAERRRVRLIRVEDGFIRSVGLGSDFVPAASLVLDSRGMHYDPNVDTDLQRLLLDTEFDKRLIGRARSLVAELVARGVTKYNLGNARLSLDAPAGRRRILVPGQVEDDLSVLFNRGRAAGNLDLLAQIREANPGAFILYKPHPDVDAGHRKGAVPDELAAQYADMVVRGVSTAALLDEIDEVHTLTSLAGFEALLRRRRVVTYGRPFYAGWGLTSDIAGGERGRRLTLEQLVAGALILYPRYLDPVTRLPCPPEIIIERLDEPELWRPGPLVIGRRIQGLLARRWKEVTGGARQSARIEG